MNTLDEIEEALARRQAPDAGVHPWALVGDDGELLAPRRVNGLRFALTYRSLTGAQLGQRVWGGTLVDRRSPT